MTNIDLLDLIEEIQDAITYLDDKIPQVKGEDEMLALCIGKKYGMATVLDMIQERLSA